MAEFDKSFNLPKLDRFVPGALGLPGDRAFYIQLVTDRNAFSFKCEKEQVLALAAHLKQLLEELQEKPPSHLPTKRGLETPVSTEWTLGTMGLAYSERTDRIAIWFDQFQAQDDTTPPAQGSLNLTRGQAAAFVRDANKLEKGGRPPCELCGTPLNEPDAWCPCWN